MKHTKRRLAIIATSTAAVLIGGGVAVAYWTSSGSGTGSAGVGNTAALQVSGVAAVGTLYPGASTPVNFTVSNPDLNNAVQVNDVTVTVTGVNQVQPLTVGTCLASDFTVSHTAPLAPVTIAANSSANQGTFGGYLLNMANTSSNQDACKGATVNLSAVTN